MEGPDVCASLSLSHTHIHTALVTLDLVGSIPSGTQIYRFLRCDNQPFTYQGQMHPSVAEASYLPAGCPWHFSWRDRLTHRLAQSLARSRLGHSVQTREDPLPQAAF